MHVRLGSMCPCRPGIPTRTTARASGCVSPIPN